MALGLGIEVVNATIAINTSLSGAVALGAKTLVGIAMPAAWDTAGLSFQVSADGGTTFLEMQTISAAVAVTAAAGQFIGVDPAVWRGVNLVKVRSGTSGSPVNQAAERVVGLVLRVVH